MGRGVSGVQHVEYTLHPHGSLEQEQGSLWGYHGSATALH